MNIYSSFEINRLIKQVNDLYNDLISKRNNLNLYEKSITSQNGEDGIIEEIFRRIGTTNKFFVEFGVQDGMQCNSAYLSVYNHWNGLLIEGDRDMYERALFNYQGKPVSIVNSFITRDNIVSIFKENEVPVEIDLLSIDIDGNDYWVWKSLEEYRPRVVIVEYNASYAPPIEWIMEYNDYHVWDGTDHFGASLTSYTKLANEMGYSLICTESQGVNAFFVRTDLLTETLSARTPEECYHPPKYGVFFGGHPKRTKTENLPASAFQAEIQTDVVEVTGPPGSMHAIEINIKNIGNYSWPFIHDYPFHLGNHWLDDKKQTVLFNDARISIPGKIRPSAGTKLIFPFTCPIKPGVYYLEFDLVIESVAWFRDFGSKTAEVKIVVE
ncbi:hypothetical protein [Paenibacillus antri]|uniref:hypothetical protein n=1 Tax=Paenibacillus antri TaxID=2582848 RepID=UPI001EE4C350|nr:hypothetical protein [Paenibacillus antri]